MDAGFYLGIGGVVTYKKSTLAGVLEKTGPDRVVLETDSPWLSPVPHRGQRNEPGYLVHIADRLASIFGLSRTEVAEITTANARAIFKI
jgi:TatD DNase family protein